MIYVAVLMIQLRSSVQPNFQAHAISKLIALIFYVPDIGFYDQAPLNYI